MQCIENIEEEMNIELEMVNVPWVSPRPYEYSRIHLHTYNILANINTLELLCVCCPAVGFVYEPTLN